MDVSGVVMTIVSVTVGVLLIGSLLIPQAEQVIAGLQTDHPDWAGLLGVVVICTLRVQEQQMKEVILWKFPA